MSRWTIQYKRGPSHGIAIPTDPLYSPTVPTDPLRARAALLKQAFVPGVEKGVRSLVAEEGAEDDGESALRSLELVEALCDGKCVHAALAERGAARGHDCLADSGARAGASWWEAGRVLPAPYVRVQL